jgi:hypothetical protein
MDNVDIQLKINHLTERLRDEKLSGRDYKLILEERARLRVLLGVGRTVVKYKSK